MPSIITACLTEGVIGEKPFAVGASVETPAAGFVVCDSDDYRLQYHCEKGKPLKSLACSDQIVQHLTGGLLQF